MEKETRYILSDLLDIVEKLTEIVRDLNPGADLKFVDFLVARADQTLETAPGAEC